MLQSLHLKVGICSLLVSRQIAKKPVDILLYLFSMFASALFNTALHCPGFPMATNIVVVVGVLAVITFSITNDFRIFQPIVIKVRLLIGQQYSQFSYCIGCLSCPN